jgi:CelD/BcsL family acetyltransferase involved in cellulose biosynthesis
MSKPAIQLRPLDVEVLTDEAGFDAIKADWDELLSESNQRVYFLRWSWNRCWWQTHAPANSRLYLIVCHDAGGKLVGLAPLYWRQRSLAGINHLTEVMFLGTGVPTSTSEHLDLIARRGHERTVAHAIAKFLLQAQGVDRLWLSDVPITSVILPHFRQALGCRQSIRICNRSHNVDTRGDWVTFHRSLGKSMRSNVGYYTRRLFKSYDCKFRRIETQEDLGPAMEAFVRLHQARWQSKGEPGSFALPSFEGFLREAMHSSLIEGRLRLWTLDLNGQTAAVLLVFLDNGVAHYFQGGFDPAYAKDSLGTVMCGLCIRACIEAKDVDEFDFMGGDPAYKERWTQSSRDSVALEWLRPSVRTQLFTISEQGEHAGRSFLRLVTPLIIKETIQAVRRKRIHSK